MENQPDHFIRIMEGLVSNGKIIRLIRFKQKK